MKVWPAMLHSVFQHLELELQEVVLGTALLRMGLSLGVQALRYEFDSEIMVPYRLTPRVSRARVSERRLHALVRPHKISSICLPTL
jgi:hypothetical protein